MLLRALAATSAEGWEEEDEKLRSQVDADRIKNVVGDDDDGEGPLKQPALPATFGSFLGARGAALGMSAALHADDTKDRGKEGRERLEERKKKKTGGRNGFSLCRGRDASKNLVRCSLSNPTSPPTPRPTKLKQQPR